MIHKLVIFDAFESFLNKRIGQIIHGLDYVVHAKSFHVIPRPNVNPLDGFKDLKDPAYEASSPMGWNKDESQDYKDTRGNNAQVGTIPLGEYNPIYATANNDTFSSKWNPSKPPQDPDNQKTAIINAFYGIKLK